MLNRGKSCLCFLLVWYNTGIVGGMKMDPRELLKAYAVAEQLKDTTRHCYTSEGRHESVAEHSWMMTLMAYFMKDEFQDLDMGKVIEMCIIHDLGECFTGDIPTFEKNEAQEEVEENLLQEWVNSLPQPYADEMTALYAEMSALQTKEAKLYKAIDNLEAVIQHNLSDIHTWLPLEYDLQLTYGNDKVQFSDYLKQLREEIRNDTIHKIETEGTKQ